MYLFAWKILNAVDYVVLQMQRNWLMSLDKKNKQIKKKNPYKNLQLS